MTRTLIAISLAIVILLSVSPALATFFDFYRDDGTSGTTFDVGYEGDMSEVPNLVVKNKNLACSITCTFTTSQGKNGNVPGVTGNYIPAYSPSTSPRFAIPVVAQGSKTLTTTMTCHDEESTLCNSDDSYTLSKQISLTWDYCGDGARQDAHETCEGGSKLCSQIDGKYYSSKSAPCKNDCSGYNTGVCEYCGDGVKNGIETCDDGSRNNQACTPQYGSSCTYCSSSCQVLTKKGPYCGDGNKDAQENCGNCYQDAPCEDGQGACSSTGECIDLDSDNNCGVIGNKCSTTPQGSSTGKRYCSSDFVFAIEEKEVTAEKCIGKQCIRQQPKLVEERINCKNQNTYCQEGQCGCKSRFEKCDILRQCVQVGIVISNDPCSCDFQCKSGICEGKVCIEGLISNFNSQKTVIRPNEETGLNFAVNNPFNSPITASLIVKLGSGVGTSAVLSGQDCRGSQCTSSLSIPAKGNADVSLTLQGNSIGEVAVQATLSYDLKGKTIQPTKELNIRITECGEADCAKPAPSSGFLVLLKRIASWFSRLF